MARETDMDNASASSDGQSKPRDYSDTTSDTSSTVHHAGNGGAHHHHLHRHGKHHHQKHHHVGGGRVHARVPSSKTVHKSHHGHAHGHGQAAPKLTRRTTSPTDRSHSRNTAAAAAAGANPSSASAHRRSTSEVKLSSRNSSSGHLPKSTSHSSLLKRNRSHGEVAKANRSSDDKLHRTSSGSRINRLKANKGQVTFDIGGDDPDPEDEWVDASGSNSPYMSRKGSLISSGQSSLRPETNTTQHNNNNNNTNLSSNNSSRPQTPQTQSVQPSADASPAEQERVRHKEYLTSRVLKRSASHGAPPQMTADLAQGSLPRHSPESDGINGSLSTSANQEGLTSRFVETPGSGVISDGSFFNQAGGSVRRLANGDSRVHSETSFTQADRTRVGSEVDNSVLVPRTAGRTVPLPAETSRTQQKLNLQRQSSVLEPGQSLNSVAGVSGANPLIGVGGPGYDGANSRDPRVGRLLERTGMEYLVVRRYQNPIARSLNRLGRLPSLERNKRIPRPNTPLANGKKSAPVDPAARHARNVSMPDPRQTAQPRRVATIRSNGAGSSYDDREEMSRSGAVTPHDRMSGSSNVGDEANDTATLLRGLWERSMDLSASAD